MCIQLLVRCICYANNNLEKTESSTGIKTLKQIKPEFL